VIDARRRAPSKAPDAGAAVTDASAVSDSSRRDAAAGVECHYAGYGGCDPSSCIPGVECCPGGSGGTGTLRLSPALQLASSTPLPGNPSVSNVVITWNGTGYGAVSAQPAAGTVEFLAFDRSGGLIGPSTPLASGAGGSVASVGLAPLADGFLAVWTDGATTSAERVTTNGGPAGAAFKLADSALAGVGVASSGTTVLVSASDSGAPPALGTVGGPPVTPLSGLPVGRGGSGSVLWAGDRYALALVVPQPERTVFNYPCALAEISETGAILNQGTFPGGGTCGATTAHARVALQRNNYSVAWAAKCRATSLWFIGQIGFGFQGSATWASSDPLAHPEYSVAPDPLPDFDGYGYNAILNGSALRFGPTALRSEYPLPLDTGSTYTGLVAAGPHYFAAVGGSATSPTSLQRFLYCPP